MLSRKTFNSMIQWILDKPRKDAHIISTLQEYGETDLTSFSMNIDHILSWLKYEMHDKWNTIEWWLYDCPQQGESDDPSDCLIKEQDGTGHYIKTSDDLYDYLTEYAPEFDTWVEQYAYDKQGEGVKFCLNTIDSLIKINTQTHNEEFESKNAILKLIRSRIIDDYYLAGCEYSKLPKKAFLITKEDLHG